MLKNRLLKWPIRKALARKYDSPVLVNDMQPPPPPIPLSKVDKFSLLSKKLRNVLKRMQKQFFDLFFCLTVTRFRTCFRNVNQLTRKIKSKKSGAWGWRLETRWEVKPHTHTSRDFRGAELPYHEKYKFILFYWHSLFDNIYFFLIFL